MDRMSKFTYPWMRIRIRIPAREAPRMRIHMLMSVQDPRMWIHMRIPFSRYPWMGIFVTFLNNTRYYRMGAAFVNQPIKFISPTRA